MKIETSPLFAEGNAFMNMDISMKLTMMVEGQTMTMDMSMDCVVNKLGDSVTVKLPTDLDTYEEMIGGADAPAA